MSRTIFIPMDDKGFYLKHNDAPFENQNVKIRITRNFRQIKRIAHLMNRYSLYEKSYSCSAFKLFATDLAIRKNWVGCIYAIATAHIDDKIIGLAIHSHRIAFYACEITCYVEPEYRLRGIGTRLTKSLIKDVSLYSNQFPEEFKQKIASAA